jgi:hypothetical protein
VGSEAEDPLSPDQRPILPLRIRGGSRRSEKALSGGDPILIPEYKTPDGESYPGFFIAHIYFFSNDLAG